jgi:hypothetical protein
MTGFSRPPIIRTGTLCRYQPAPGRPGPVAHLTSEGPTNDASNGTWHNARPMAKMPPSQTAILLSAFVTPGPYRNGRSARCDPRRGRSPQPFIFGREYVERGL